MKNIGGLWLPDSEMHMVDSYSSGNGYDTDLIEHITDNGLKRKVGIDGGAHIGSCAIEMETHFDIIYAIEANRDVYECLVENVKTHERIKPILGCLSAMKWGRADITIRRDGNTGSGQCFPGDDVELITIDELVGADQLAGIKLDIEGMEYQALLGGIRAILRDCPPIVYEFKPRLSMAYDMLDDKSGELLKRLGYKQTAIIRKNMVWKRSPSP